MKMIFRWFGSNDDSVLLDQIKQIPGMSGVAGTLTDIPVGEVWPFDRIQKLKKEITDSGLCFEVVESVNVHEDIKLGLPTRARYIENYKETIRNLAKCGVKVICYNFMPVFDWTRSELSKKMPDGSKVLAYEKDKIERIDPQVLIEKIKNASPGYSLPGWEPERLKTIKRLMEQYSHVSEEDMFQNLKCFLEEIIPVAEEHDVKMAIHPDDPPWRVFGLPRIITNKKNLERIVGLVDSPYNGVTLCSGSLGANPENDISGMMSYFSKMGRVPFVHVRNLKICENGDFVESSHRSCDGSLDLYEILKALHDSNYTGYIRPDHGRMIWNEQARPGYGLYDRALGAMYIWGIWDSLEKTKKAVLVEDHSRFSGFS